MASAGAPTCGGCAPDAAGIVSQYWLSALSAGLAHPGTYAAPAGELPRAMNAAARMAKREPRGILNSGLMLADQAAVTTRLEHRAAGRERRRARPWPRGLRLERTVAFVGAAALMLVYALRGGGSYDLVSFEEQGLVTWCVLAIGIALGLLPRA